MKAFNKNNTWDLFELPIGKGAVECEWVFTIMHKADGSVERYMVRLITKGYLQTQGINYEETFA